MTEAREPAAPRLTLAPLVKTYAAARRAHGDIGASTLRNHCYVLNGFAASFAARPLAQLGPAAVERWMDSRAHLAPGTRRNQLSVVRTFCQWLRRTGRLKGDPCADVYRIHEPRRVPRALAAADVGRVLAVCPDDRARLIVLLMIGLGLRCIEIARLDVADYDQDAGLLMVVGKGGHERVLPVPTLVASALNATLSREGYIAGPLIRSTTHPGQGLSNDTISLYVARWFTAAGVKQRAHDGRSAHALRHTAASDVLDRCGDLRVVQAMLGHANLATTSMYLRRARLEGMREAMEGRDYRSSAHESDEQPR